MAIAANPRVFADEDGAMIVLGVGKNMVRAIRFWAQAAGVSEIAADGKYISTTFGHAVLDKGGFDPFLEDVRTLWLIHWNLTSNTEEPLFAWDYLFSRWQHPELTRSAAVRAFEQEAARMERRLSRVTLEQHFDTFLHTYVPTRSPKGDVQEDNLDCPLIELDLLQKIGERADSDGRREPIYAFRREPKEAVTPELFVFCLADFWRKQRSSERTLSFRDVSVLQGSPGQVLKLPESDIRERLESIEVDSLGAFSYRESASLPQIIRQVDQEPDFLASVYRQGNA